LNKNDDNKNTVILWLSLLVNHHNLQATMATEK